MRCYWFSLVAFCLMVCGCRTKYIPVESLRYDSLVVAKLVHDSVYVRDSVFVRERGDTVYKYKDKYVYVYKTRIDTFFAERVRDVELPVPVERELSWWERMKMDFGGWLLVAVALYVVYRMVRWWVIRTRKG